MGIYDRDYMTETEEGINSGKRRYTAVIMLLIVNIVIWVAWQFAGADEAFTGFMYRHFTVSTESTIGHWRLYTLVTASFSHNDLWHILFNMIFYWILAEDVERIYGYRNFIWLYIFAGIVASVAYLGLNLARGHPNPMLGASGAIMGIAVVAAIFDPQKPISLMGLITLPLRTLVIIYIVLDVLGAFRDRDLIAHSAHLGGALAGYVYWKADLRVFASPGRENVGLLYRVRRWFRRKPRLRVVERTTDEFAQVETDTARGPAPRVDAATNRRVDELLGKVSREGLDALTGEERAFLEASSRKYKQR